MEPVTHMDINTLFKLAQNGEKKAFSKLYSQYYLPMLKYASARVDNRHEAEDIVSELFKKVLTHIKEDPIFILSLIIL